MVYGFRVPIESNWSVPDLTRFYDLFGIPGEMRLVRGHSTALSIVARFFDLETFPVGDGPDPLSVVVGFKLVGTADRAVEFDVTTLTVNPYSQRVQNLRMMIGKMGVVGNPGYFLVPRNW